MENNWTDEIIEKEKNKENFFSLINDDDDLLEYTVEFKKNIKKFVQTQIELNHTKEYCRDTVYGLITLLFGKAFIEVSESHGFYIKDIISQVYDECVNV